MESTLKRQLKAWQREFRQQHGREPSRKDMDKVPHVAAIYDQWHASQGSKPKASSSSSSASRQDSKRAEQPRLKAAREKTRRPLVDPSTPSKRRPAGGGGDPFKTPTKPASASKHYSPSVKGSGGSVVDAGLTTAATLASPSAMTPSRPPKVASPWGSTAATWSYYGETPSSPALAKALASPSPSRLTAGPTPTAAATVITPSKSKAQRERLDRAIMQLEYTPRTKARKRLRGEAVPKTPAARRVASGPAGKRRGARGLLVVDEEDDDGDGSEVRDRRPEKRQKSQGQTRTLAQFGFGAVGGKGKRAADEVDDDDEEEACLGPSPNRANRAKGLFQGSVQASSSSYQPLFGPVSSKRQWLDDDDEEEEEEEGEGESEMEGEGTVEEKEGGAFSSTSSSTSSPRSSAMDTATLLHRQRGSLSSPPTEMTPVPMEDVPMHDASLGRGSRAGLDREEQGAARTEGGIALKPYRLFERPVRPSNSFSDDDDEDEDGEGWPGLSRRPTTTITILDNQEAEEEEEDIKIDGLTLSSPSAQGKSARRARRIRDEEVLRRLLGDSSTLVLEEGDDGEEKWEWDERGKNVAKTASTTWGEAKGKNNTGPKKGAKKAAAIAAAAEKLKEEEARREERKENLVFKTMARAGVGDAEEGDEEAEAGADEWDSEVDEAEYGLGDGYMDEVDVI